MEVVVPQKRLRLRPYADSPRGIGIARGQNTEANANTQPGKPAWSCPCNDPFGHREIPESMGSALHLSPRCNAFCACGRAWLALNLIPRGSAYSVLLPRLILKVDDLEAAVLRTRLRACVSL